MEQALKLVGNAWLLVFVFLQLGYWFFSQLSLGYWCSKPIWRWWKRCTRAIFSFFSKVHQEQLAVYHWHLRSHLIFPASRETETIGFPIQNSANQFLRRRRLSLMSPDRGRWSILKPLPAFILVFLRLSHEMYAFKAMNSILTPLSLSQITLDSSNHQIITPPSSPT